MLRTIYKDQYVLVFVVALYIPQLCFDGYKYVGDLHQIIHTLSNI